MHSKNSKVETQAPTLRQQISAVRAEMTINEARPIPPRNQITALRAAIASLDRLERIERGEFVIVPREPTEAMLFPNGEKQIPYIDFHRRDDAAGIWRAMVKAFEKVPPADEPDANAPASLISGEVRTKPMPAPKSD